MPITAVPKKNAANLRRICGKKGKRGAADKRGIPFEELTFSNDFLFFFIFYPV
jgi:hypothetical protein